MITVNTRAIAIAIAACLLIGLGLGGGIGFATGHWLATIKGNNAVAQASVTANQIIAAHAEKAADAATALAEQTTRARSAEQQIAQLTATSQQELTHAQNTAQNDIDRLRNRFDQRMRQLAADAATSRTIAAHMSGVAERAATAAAAGVCNGGELSEQAGEFLISESARAETIRINYLACIQQHNGSAAILTGQ